VRWMMLILISEAISNSNAVIRREFRKLRFQMIDDMFLSAQVWSASRRRRKREIVAIFAQSRRARNRELKISRVDSSRQRAPGNAGNAGPARDPIEIRSSFVVGRITSR
jgi:hypothetical protein